MKRKKSKVAITHHANIERAINEALGHFDLRPLLRDKIVALHPNDTLAEKGDKTAVTQPDSLRAVLRYIKKFGPRELIVTGGSGAGETDEIFRAAGLMEVVESEGVLFHDHNRPPFKEVMLDYGSHPEVFGPQKSIKVNARVLEYECLIALNQLKVHETATVTLALKNIAMSFPAADYYGHPRHTQKHKNHFFADMHSYIAAMAKTFPIGLAITVGHPAMIGLGPIGGHTFETGLCIASTDALAADVAGAFLLGFRTQAVRHLWEAWKLGLGGADVDDFAYPALDIKRAFALFTKAAYGKAINPEHA